jgi:penicillin-binding protein activator
MKKLMYMSLVVLGVAVLSGCATRQVKRITPTEQIDLSGRWNATDSRLVAEELTKDVLGARWLNFYFQEHAGNRPVLIVGLIRNRSHEHIDAETFIKDIEQSIIRDGSVRLVQAGDKREALRDERADQQNFATQETAKRWGMELGADFIMQGSISSIVDQYRKRKVVYYQINLELTDLETNEIVWIGDKKIMKYITN